MRYRWPGLGAPLAASTRPVEAARAGRPHGAAAEGSADRPAHDPRGPPRPRAGTAAHGHARAPHGLGRGDGLDRRRERAARERADGGPGAHVHGHTGLPSSRRWVPRPAGRVPSGRRSFPRPRTGPGSSRSSSCTARSRAWCAGPRCTTGSWPTRRSGAAISSGSSSTTPAQPIALSALQLRDALTGAVAHMTPRARTQHSAGWC